jgi:DNA-binding GntR family transcriptional regulator
MQDLRVMQGTTDLSAEPLAVKTLIEAVTDRLRAEIVNGGLPPGGRLVERQLAAAYGVSTIAVREAFARLAEEGLVQRIPRRGAFVSELSPDALRDLTRVRIALEQLAVELAMQHWTPELERSLRAIVKEMQEAGKAVDAQRLLELDLAFHRAFVDAADSEALSEVLGRLASRLEQFLRRANATLAPDEARGVSRVHKSWLEAVASGDVARARAAVLEHISYSCETLVERIARNDAR